MRNPERIALFLKCMLPYENKILTNDIINMIIQDVIMNKLYKPTYVNHVESYKAIFDDEDKYFDKYQILDIINNSSQKHKEAGFDYGWPSRFDTWYKLSKEFGFIFYEMNKPIVVSSLGHMLIDAISCQPIEGKKIENIFTHSLVKYSSNNPLRKTLNSNVPLVLLLKVIRKLNNDNVHKSKGIYRLEIPLFLCWPNGDADSLYEYIRNIRTHYKFSYSEEFIYDRCLEILNAEEKDKKYYKLSKICKESVDEYIRKMRMTGLLSLRGNGRFLDENKFEYEKINYILKEYPTEKNFCNIQDYFEYIKQIDLNIINIQNYIPSNSDEIRRKTIEKFAKKYSKQHILSELKILGTGGKESKDPLFRFINAPARLEFLTCIALKQHFINMEIYPQYPFDDEGIPTSTAGGGVADIICKESKYDELIEVTLIRGRSDQINNEIIPISRHQTNNRKKNPNTFSVLLAPFIHEDTKMASEWQKVRYGVDIVTIDISTFIDLLANNNDNFYEFFVGNLLFD